MYGIALDKKNIKKLLEDFYTLTNIRIAFIGYNNKEGITVEENKICPFCAVLRRDATANNKCIECDAHAFETAGKNNNLYVYECHAGLVEAVSPIIIEGKLLGYLMMGQTLKSTPTQQMWEVVRKGLKGYDIDYTALEEAFFKLNCLDEERLLSAARIMDMSAKYIYLSRLVQIQELPLIEKVKGIVLANLDKTITISDISKELNISKSHLSHIIKAEFKLPLSQYVLNMRIARSKVLLEQTIMKIVDIGNNVGLTDPNYFSRVFKKATGLSPNAYRIMTQQKAALCKF